MRYKKPDRAADFLPDPETLEAYDYVIEGSAPRLLEMIEKEQIHRHEAEARSLSIQASGLFFGQFLAAAIAFSIIISATILGLNGQVALSALIGSIGIASMAAAYIKSREAMVRDLKQTMARERKTRPAQSYQPKMAEATAVAKSKPKKQPRERQSRGKEAPRILREIDEDKEPPRSRFADREA